MIILLHGPDSYRSRHKLNALIARFKEQRDPEGTNVVRLEGGTLTLDELNSKLAAGSLFAEKRLVHVHGLFSHAQEDVFKKLLSYLENVDSDNVVIFYEDRELEPKGYGAKKLTAARKKLLDLLKQQPYSEYFASLGVAQQNAWIMKQLQANNLAIDAGALKLLVARSDNDLWLLSHSLRKLIHHARGNGQARITEADVRALTADIFNETIFALTDALSNARTGELFRQLEEQLDAGAALPQLLALLQKQVKTLLQVKELLLRTTPPKDIARILKLHPFVVQKAVPQSRNFTLQELLALARGLTGIEYRLKTGQGHPLAELNLLLARKQ